MNRRMKKTLSWLLVICLILSFFTNLQPVVKAEADVATSLSGSADAQVLQSPVIGTRTDSGAEVTFSITGSRSI